MEFKRLVTAASVAIALGAFVPSAFAQVAGVPGVSGGAPFGVPEAPSNGQPATEMPASAAPLGVGESTYMSNEQGRAGWGENVPPTVSAAIKDEQRARSMEVTLERDIVADRARGFDVAAAQREKWLGSIALAKGDRSEALRAFNLAARDLNAQELSDRAAVNNRLTAKEIDETPDAADMHPNLSARTAY